MQLIEKLLDFPGGSIRTLKSRALPVFAMAILAAGTANADESVEWRVLGPAWSHHMSKEYATYEDAGVDTVVPGSECTEVTRGDVTTPCLTDAVSTRTASLHWECGQSQKLYSPDYSSVLGATRKCDLVEAHRKPVWHQMNPSVGLSRTVKTAKDSDTLFAGYVTDSYGSPTLMAGYTHQWRVLSVSTIRADAGVTTGVWWRTDTKFEDTTAAFKAGKSEWYYEQHLHRHFQPVVLPMLSVTEARTGVGFNLAYAPRVTVDNHMVNSTAVWMLQSTLRISSTPLGSTTVGAESMNGGAQFNVTKTF